MDYIRKANTQDSSRLTELKNVWVYDDEFVKGMIHIEGKELLELYVDSFFQNEGHILPLKSS